MKTFGALTTDSPVNAFDETCGKQKYDGKKKKPHGRIWWDMSAGTMRIFSNTVEAVRIIKQCKVSENRAEAKQERFTAVYAIYDTFSQSVQYQHNTQTVMKNAFKQRTIKAFPPCWRGSSGIWKSPYGDMTLPFPLHGMPAIQSRTVWKNTAGEHT